MSSLNFSDLRKIADLSKLIILQSENDSLLQSLNKTFELVAKMNNADTSDVAPLAHPCNETQPLREDNITESNQRELFQKNAPQIESGLYIVPIVINNEG